MKNDSGPALIARLYNSLTQKAKNNISDEIKKDIASYMIDQGYSSVQERWYPNTEIKESEAAHGRLKTLTCSCCGRDTKGRQWYSRDKGYGLCNSCADWMKPRYEPEYLQQCYGKEGVHYNVK